MSQLCFFIFKGTADVISNDSPFKRGNFNLQQFMHELFRVSSERNDSRKNANMFVRTLQTF